MAASSQTNPTERRSENRTQRTARGVPAILLLIAASAPAALARAQSERVAAEPAADQPLELSLALREGGEAMTADQIAALATETAPSVARAQAASRRAQEAASQALIAVYPRLDLEARYSRLEGVPAVTIADRVFEPQTDRYLLEARLSVPLSDLFLQILPRYRAAKDLAQAQAASSRAERQSVGLLAREVFYNYARARASLLVARSSVAQTEAQRSDVESMVSAGSMARVELMRAEAQVASARGSLARSEGAVAVARTTLRSMLHREGEQDIAITEDLTQPLPALVETNQQLLQRATNNRSELRALRAIVSAQERSISASHAGKLPKLAIGVTYDYAKPNPNVFSFEDSPPWSDNWIFFGMLSWSPNDFATAGSLGAQAEADRAQTLADVQAMMDALRREVTQSAEDYRSAREAMDAGLVGIRAAEESYRVRREQFRAGAAVATDVVDAESELRRARLELINSAIDVRIAAARLARATETGPNQGPTSTP
jgi:outer membrane protein